MNLNPIQSNKTAKPPNLEINQLVQEYRIAAIVPAINEEVSIANTVKGLLQSVPGITVYVYDNGSEDATAQRAKQAGAIVRHVPQRGKGNVIRRAFSDIEADIYVMIDGDDTYDCANLPEMIYLLVNNNLDHVLGVRAPEIASSAYRAGHSWGNKMFNRLTSAMLGTRVADMLSGYRVFSRRFVKSFPCASTHFEIETELTVHLTAVRAPQGFVKVGFKERQAGSESKLHTVRDGWRISRTIFRLYRYEFPLRFYSVIAGFLAVISLVLGFPVVGEYLQTGIVPRFPTAILASSIGIISILCLFIGMIIKGQARAIEENRRLHYLQIPSLKQ